MNSYRLLENGSAIWCVKCGFISFNPNDVAQRYCALCKVFHDDAAPMFHFECPECQFSDDEAGFLSLAEVMFCPLCESDTRHVVQCRTWRASEGKK